MGHRPGAGSTIGCARRRRCTARSPSARARRPAARRDRHGRQRSGARRRAPAAATVGGSGGGGGRRRWRRAAPTAAQRRSPGADRRDRHGRRAGRPRRHPGRARPDHARHDRDDGPADQARRAHLGPPRRGGGRPTQRTATDDDGRFRFNDIGPTPGLFRLTVFRPGFDVFSQVLQDRRQRSRTSRSRSSSSRRPAASPVVSSTRRQLDRRGDDHRHRDRPRPPRRRPPHARRSSSTARWRRRRCPACCSSAECRHAVDHGGRRLQRPAPAPATRARRCPSTGALQYSTVSADGDGSWQLDGVATPATYVVRITKDSLRLGQPDRHARRRASPRAASTRARCAGRRHRARHRPVRPRRRRCAERHPGQHDRHVHHHDAHRRAGRRRSSCPASRSASTR